MDGPGSNIQWSNETTVNRVGSTTKASDVDAQNARRVLQMTDSYLLTLQELCGTEPASRCSPTNRGPWRRIPRPPSRQRSGTNWSAPSFTCRSNPAWPARLRSRRPRRSGARTFTYVAPGAADNVSTLTFTSTSRRGIGKVSSRLVPRAEESVPGRRRPEHRDQRDHLRRALLALHAERKPARRSNVTSATTPAATRAAAIRTRAGRPRGLQREWGLHDRRRKRGHADPETVGQRLCHYIPGGTCASYTNEVTLTPMEPCN